MKKIISKSIKIVLFTTIYSANSLSNANEPNEFTGHWSPDCEVLQGFQIISRKAAELEVNSNQIYIKTKLSTEKNDTAIYFDDVLDLGSGGMQLDWKNFSKDKAIGKIKNWSDKEFIFEWIGFYNKKNSTTYWKENPDFFQKGKINFYKCPGQP
ncbi:hypothetical protein [Pseudomonas sp. MOIL14HWK12:I2]|uniref:hypothetical protein n=1 Tax=Pseudomonas sp. MOIL14HWK12:I2 TaxID=1033994 RepID=UPI0012EB0BE8|nr:hypothetical protein [Pseudomonas sp. MOIL14HWK12:I2]